MKTFRAAPALPVLAAVALLGLAACKVNVDTKSKADLDHAADSAGAALERAGKDAAKLADKAGKSVEHGADAVQNGVDSHVNVHIGDGGGRVKGR
ncbi:MAG TPA: hypothetical protein VKI45_01865 [Allosphingosinicella sp.]|nr:hypothetical protein [Allosphingosinicella sp.]